MYKQFIFLENLSHSAGFEFATDLETDGYKLCSLSL